MREREEVLREFGTDALVAVLPFPVSENVERMADEIVRLREALAAATRVTDVMRVAAAKALAQREAESRGHDPMDQWLTWSDEYLKDADAALTAAFTAANTAPSL